MNNGIPCSFPRKLGNVFMRVKRQAYLHQAKDKHKQDGKGQRKLNQRLPSFSSQRISTLIKSRRKSTPTAETHRQRSPCCRHWLQPKRKSGGCHCPCTSMTDRPRSVTGEVIPQQENGRGTGAEVSTLTKRRGEPRLPMQADVAADKVEYCAPPWAAEQA
jgi:hypothetical protein